MVLADQVRFSVASSSFTVEEVCQSRQIHEFPTIGSFECKSF